MDARGREVGNLLSREWLLTNERGSFAASTVAGCNTSGYHGLLIGSPEPLVNRVMAVSNCLETIIWEGHAAELSTFEFADRLAPEGYLHLVEFRRDIAARFQFSLEPADLEKAVYLARDCDAVVVEYTFNEVRAPFDLVLRPFIGLRDFHALQKADAPLTCTSADPGLFIRHALMTDCDLLLDCPDLTFTSNPQWWFNFVYRVNRDRGLPCTEDLWTPGFFKGHIEGPGRVTFWACLGHRADALPTDIEAVKRDLSFHQKEVIRAAGDGDRTFAVLCLAADQFIAKRRSAGRERTTIVAGYPWFVDWGRDTFISLPGLLLTTGRYDEAESVLKTFAAAVDGGMVPNRFDDHTGAAHFNSVDASLWFVNAAFGYLGVTGDTEMFVQDLLPAIRQILEAYEEGTYFGIHADKDGLITAGDAATQLTWMDAKWDETVFTPRYGKTVEVNALWHNALCRMQGFCERQKLGDARRYARMAEQVGRSFRWLFWNAERNYLNDVILPDGTVDAKLRPNQIFAVSVPFGPPLTRSQQQAVVEVVARELLTPYGLRTLNRQDPAYRGRYEGSPRSRDGAYHQGTVWPYLMGPFLEAYLRIHDYSRESKQTVAEWIRPLLRHLVEDGCLGSISEIFDGDPPHRPAGCPAQAWSVAEIIRVYRMIM